MSSNGPLYVNTGDRLSDLLSKRGDIAAEAARRQGQIAANAASQSGQIWGSALQNIGSTVGHAIEEGPKLKAQQDEMDARVADRQAQTRARQQQEADTAALDAVDYTDREKALASVPGHLRAHVADSFQKLDESAARIQEQKDKGAAQQAKLLEEHTDYTARLAMGVAPFLDGPDGGANALQVALATGVKHGVISPEDAANYTDQLSKSDPAAIKQLVQGLINQSPTVAKEYRESSKPTVVHEGDTLLGPDNKPVYSAPKPPPPPKMVESIEPGPNGEPVKYMRTEAQMAAGRPQYVKSEKGAENEITSFEPGALDQAALRYAKRGDMAALGMGNLSLGLRVKIQNRAAELYPNEDIALNAGVFKANADTYSKLKSQTTMTDAFTATADKNAALLDKALDKIPDLGSKTLNWVARNAASEFGSKDMAAFATLRKTVQDEYAGILQKATTGGAPVSDAQRKAVETILDENAPVASIREALKQLKAESSNRSQEYHDQLRALRREMGSNEGEVDSYLEPGVKPIRSGGANTDQTGAKAPVPIKDNAEWEKLAPGTVFIGPDGKTRVK